jgi:uncharacterized protein (DUF934 family)
VGDMNSTLINEQIYLKLITYKLGFSAQASTNEWAVLKNELIDGTLRVSDYLPSKNVLMPFSQWIEISSSKDIQERSLRGEIGVWFSVEDDILKYSDLIYAGKKLWSIIAIDFPIFRDGRGFSTAALIRQRFGWQGELRAIGDVLIDQLIQLSRVGFDSFELRDDQDLITALKQFDLFTVTTQNAWRAKRSLIALPERLETT